MIVLGIVLLLLGYFLAIPILTTIGIVAIIVGIILFVVPIGGHTRRWY